MSNNFFKLFMDIILEEIKKYKILRINYENVIAGSLAKEFMNCYNKEYYKIKI